MSPPLVLLKTETKSLPKTWPRETIRELLTLAETEGASHAELETAREASLFRFAVYTLRRQEKLGLDISIIVDGSSVFLTKKTRPAVRILNQTPEASRDKT